jgi:transcriptional regulator with XRE-family HTH domain
VDQKEQQRERLETRRSVLEAIRDEAGFRKMVDLARELGVDQSTLTNIQSGKRSASPELIEKIRKLAPKVGNRIKILSAEPDDGVGPSAEVPPPIEQRLDQDRVQRINALRAVEEDEQANIEAISGYFDALNKGDVFIYMSALETPLEMRPQGTALLGPIASAIQREAVFLYLMPTKEYLQSIEAASMEKYIDIARVFVDFEKNILLKISNEDIHEECRSRLRLLRIQIKENPFFALPDFKWDLFLSKRGKAKASMLVASDGPRIRMPASEFSTRTFLFEIAETIFKANRNLPDSDRVPRDVVSHLIESAESATGGKIDRS